MVSKLTRLEAIEVVFTVLLSSNMAENMNGRARVSVL